VHGTTTKLILNWWMSALNGRSFLNMDLERADTFTEYRDMSDIVSPSSPTPATANPNRDQPLPFFSYFTRSHEPNIRGNDVKTSAPPLRTEDIYGGKESFAEISERTKRRITQQSNVPEQADEILDEETWNWPALTARVFAFFLLFAIIVSIALQTISKRFLILAALICILLVIVIIGTYVDIKSMFLALICPRKQEEIASDSIENPLRENR
jgi:hypothetical protein